MSIGFYPRYDRLGASSRYRFFMFCDRWRALETADRAGGCSGLCAGCLHVCDSPPEIHSGLSDRYLRELYRRGRVSGFRKVWEWLRLWRRALTLADRLVIEYELLPGVPWNWERRLIGPRPYVLNFDDNVWEKYRNRRRLQDKYDRLCEHAAGVIVANHFLYEKVRPLNPNLVLIPTVVDLDSYTGAEQPKWERFTVVWIGTPVTYRYLEQHLACLQAMARAVDYELLIVADRRLAARPLAGVRTRYVDWSAESEGEWLARSHVGIMPLSDDDFSRGKSAFKLVQYQAAGLPALASPVGENRRVIDAGKNGFLVETPEEWAAALRLLHDGADFYRNCAENARARAYDYSLQKYFPIYRDFILKALNQ